MSDENKECIKETIPHDTGGVPNYIVNLPDLEDTIKQAIKNSACNDSNGIQRSKGFLILSEEIGVEEAIWEVPYEIELTGLTFAQEEVRNMGYDDYINIYIDDELYFETIYLKEVQEGKWFRNMVKVEKGSTIKIEYVNQTDIEKEFKIDLEYITKAPIVFEPISPPPIEPEPIEPEKPEAEEPEIEVSPELLPIYRIYLRYEGGVTTDLDIYANLYNSTDGSDITPSKTIGFSRRQWGINTMNIAKVAKVNDNHLGHNDRQNEPEIIEIYGKPSKYFRFFVVNYKDGHKLEEDITMEMYQVDEFGNDSLPLAYIVKHPTLFYNDNARVNFFDFAIETESIVEL